MEAEMSKFHFTYRCVDNFNFILIRVIFIEWFLQKKSSSNYARTSAIEQKWPVPFR